MRETSNVSPQVWRDWILEAIRKIRCQKQRPSIQRICQAIGSHHKFHEDIVAEKLEEAVESGAVIKVYNKGLHSYKAPIAKRRLAVNHNNTDLSRLVARAVRELGECDGSTYKSIENYVQNSNAFELAPDTDLRSVIKNSVKKAVTQGYLVHEGKLYKVGKDQPSPKKRTTKGGDVSPVHGSPKKRIAGGSAAPSSSKAKPTVNLSCAECMGNDMRGPRGTPESLSTCSNCDKAFHATCANLMYRGSQKVALNNLMDRGSRWFCDQCRTCDRCEKSDIAKGPCLLGCHLCDNTYHFGCMDPIPEKTPKCAWRCGHCLERDDPASLGKRRLAAREEKGKKRGRPPGRKRHNSDSDEDSDDDSDDDVPDEGRRSGQAMSKEKQKFFRLSAFNCDRGQGQPQGSAAAAATPEQAPSHNKKARQDPNSIRLGVKVSKLSDTSDDDDDSHPSGGGGAVSATAYAGASSSSVSAKQRQTNGGSTATAAADRVSDDSSSSCSSSNDSSSSSDSCSDDDSSDDSDDSSSLSSNSSLSSDEGGGGGAGAKPSGSGAGGGSSGKAGGNSGKKGSTAFDSALSTSSSSAGAGGAAGLTLNNANSSRGGDKKGQNSSFSFTDFSSKSEADSGVWGFAAEAKKSADVFAVPSEQRIFGEFGDQAKEGKSSRASGTARSRKSSAASQRDVQKETRNTFSRDFAETQDTPLGKRRGSRAHSDSNNNTNSGAAASAKKEQKKKAEVASTPKAAARAVLTEKSAAARESLATPCRANNATTTSPYSINSPSEMGKDAEEGLATGALMCMAG